MLTQLINHIKTTNQNLKFKKTAHIHNQIQTIQHITKKQFISNTNNNLNIINITFNTNITYIHILFIHQNKILNSRSYFPKIPNNTKLNKIIKTFINQFYLQNSQIHTLPNKILLNFNLNNKTLLTNSLSKLTKHKINIQTKPHNNKTHYLKLTHTNTTTTLTNKLSQQSTIHQQLTTLTNILKLPKIKQIKYFNINHTINKQTITSYIIFNTNNPLHTKYQRYNITNITPNNNYTTINQILHQHYNKTINNNKIPNIILINNNKNQLTQTKNIFTKLNIS